jgi:hypothetical protein
VGRFISNIGRWVIALALYGFALYFVYLFTINALWQAPKGVFLFGLACALLIIYFTRDSLRDNGKKYYENGKEMFISFLLTFLLISWLSALALGFLSGGGTSPNPCMEDICDNLNIP